MKYPADDAALIHDAANKRWLAFSNPLAIYVAHGTDEVIPAMEAIEKDVRERGLWAAGFVSYEASPAFDPALEVKTPGACPLLWFGLYGEPEEVSPSFVDDREFGPLDWQAFLDPDEYRRSIERIKDYIGLGETYQVNYTYRLRTRFTDDPWPLFARMIRAQRCDYGAYISTRDWTICSASPEMFFDRYDGELASKPMKGTMPRGLWYEDDRQKADDLYHSEKNRAENVMIVDMVRNDLGRIADTGSVHVSGLFDVEQYPTLWQMTSTVKCTTNAGMTDIFRALFPPASITGAPKTRTMQIIAELENAPRQIYTGTIGFVAPNNRAQFNVAIRTVLVDRRKGTAEYGVGGGIVWDSTAGSEFEECRTKARVLTQCPPEFSLLETLLWTPDEGFFLLDRHLERVKKSAEYFSRPVDTDEICGLLDEAVRGQAQSCRVRLLVPEDGLPSIDVRLFIPHTGDYRIRLAKEPIASSNVFLYHKTTNRRVYEEALQDCPVCNDVLLWNENGRITESCIANVIVEMDGELFTPPVSCGLLPGVYRAHLLDQGKIREREIGVDELRGCTRIWLANSVRGQWAVVMSSE